MLIVFLSLAGTVADDTFLLAFLLIMASLLLLAPLLLLTSLRLLLPRLFGRHRF
jgi:hypothetical protein